MLNVSFFEHVYFSSISIFSFIIIFGEVLLPTGLRLHYHLTILFYVSIFVLCFFSRNEFYAACLLIFIHSFSIPKISSIT